MGRIIAIDYGTKRTGLAVTDPLRIIANALETVETKQLEKYLADYFSKNDVDVIVLGKPSQMNGQPSETRANAAVCKAAFICRFPLLIKRTVAMSVPTAAENLLDAIAI